MKKILLSLTFALVAFTSATLWFTRENPAYLGELSPAAGEGEPLIGGSFTLTDQHGAMKSDLDFRGKLMLVFFGFTHCPDICPITSKSLSETMALLGDKAGQVAPIFITVDPTRDTPEKMKEYFANFDPRIVALTGTAEQVKQAASAYKVYYAKSEPKAEGEGAHGHDAHGGHHASAPGDYMVDHSGYVYLMSREGKYITHFPYDAAPKAIADALAPHLE